MQPIQNSVTFQIALFNRAHRNYAARQLAKYGLYIGQDLILIQLWIEDGVTQTCLAEQVGIEISTMTKALQRLERYGLIERRPDPQDNRAVLVFLSQAGRELERGLTASWNEIEEHTLAGFTAEERQQFVGMLQRVRQNIG